MLDTIAHVGISGKAVAIEALQFIKVEHVFYFTNKQKSIARQDLSLHKGNH
jgi:hypothetical protein